MRQYQCRRGKRRCAMTQEEIEFIGRGRPLKEIIVEEYPHVTKVIPEPKLADEQITLTIAEYEAMRLVDLEGLNQAQAGIMMNVSRGTIWRLLDAGRQKLMRMLSEGIEIIFEEQKKI